VARAVDAEALKEAWPSERGLINMGPIMLNLIISTYKIGNIMMIKMPIKLIGIFEIAN